MDDTGKDKIRVDMHCHSSYSDGILTPEQIARELASAGVKYASLTDHNTIGGLHSFRNALKRYGIGYVSGLEITTSYRNHILHLLAYGFDSEFPELLSMLKDKNGSGNSELPANQAMKVYGNARDVIDLIHKAGGICILAHPIQTMPDFADLWILIGELVNIGLDGIEAVYSYYPPEVQEKLIETAGNYGITVSAGTDFHTLIESVPGIDMTREQWKSFRDRIIKGNAKKVRDSSKYEFKPRKKRKKQWIPFISNIFLPASMSLALFIVALFVILLPYFENTLMDRKRENIRQLTQAAWGVLSEAADEVESGQLTLEQAQELAKNRIEAMRYGDENKDYFWLQDLSPKILMHPYRTDLNDQDVSEFQDAQGTRIFVEFVDLVKEKGEGYVSYVWQWMDDLERMEPKESYIRLFEPWGWIIGTGVYVYDVQEEIATLRGHIVKISIGIIAAVSILLIYLVRQGMLIERSKKEAEKLLLESTERYKTLSEAATEGALFVYDGRCRYANTVMYEMLGCDHDNLELLDIEDVFPDVEINRKWLAPLLLEGRIDSPGIIPAIMKRCDGSTLSCNLSFRNELNDPKSGMMILVRRPADTAEHTGTHLALDRILHLPGSAASELMDSMKNSCQTYEIVSLFKKIPDLVVSLLKNGTSSIAVTYMITAITDVATQRIIELSVKELGTPPSEFVFIALGSHGRQSLTLFSDQDNALIYRSTGEDDAMTEKYFLKLGTLICDTLEQAGFMKCVGGKIASNPQWCKPIDVWKGYFEEWIRNSDPQQVIEFSIFFDFRPVAGNQEIAVELRNFIDPILKETPFFLSQIAQNSLIFKTPMRLFGSILTSGGKDHPGRIDVKSPAMALVSFARLYALKNRMHETNTLVRLEAIKSMGVILDSKHRDIVTAYETLVRLRLWNQALAIENSLKPDNWVDPINLGHLEEVLLREAFKEIDELQTSIQRDFLV